MPRADYKFWLDEFGYIQAACTRCGQVVDPPDLPGRCPYCGAVIYEEDDDD